MQRKIVIGPVAAITGRFTSYQVATRVGYLQSKQLLIVASVSDRPKLDHSAKVRSCGWWLVAGASDIQVNNAGSAGLSNGGNFNNKHIHYCCQMRLKLQ